MQVNVGTVRVGPIVNTTIATRNPNAATQWPSGLTRFASQMGLSSKHSGPWRGGGSQDYSELLRGYIFNIFAIEILAQTRWKPTQPMLSERKCILFMNHAEPLRLPTSDSSHNRCEGKTSSFLSLRSTTINVAYFEICSIFKGTQKLNSEFQSDVGPCSTG